MCAALSKGMAVGFIAVCITANCSSEAMDTYVGESKVDGSEVEIYVEGDEPLEDVLEESSKDGDPFDDSVPDELGQFLSEFSGGLGGVLEGGYVEGGSDEGGEADIEVGFLEHRRVSSAERDCSLDLFRSGERLELTAEDFAPNSVVKIVVVGVTLLGTAVPLIYLPSVTADAEGRIKTIWTIPDTAGQLEGSESSVPRAYLVLAGGSDAAGGNFVANMFIPLVAYPNGVPCALGDSVVTSLGRSVQIAVLANDIAPEGGTLDPASVEVDPAFGGEFVVNAADGSLTFTPDPGFTGTATSHYWLTDGWGVNLRGEIGVTVNAGCTITGTAGVADIVGTDGNDVICVPDPDDYSSFHVIEAKGGDDVILGGRGVEWVYGGPGQDEVHTRGGNDVIDAGPGIDDIYSGGGFDTIHSTDTADIIHDDPDGYELLIH